jgi:hypothetical protein
MKHRNASYRVAALLLLLQALLVQKAVGEPALSSDRATISTEGATARQTFTADHGKGQNPTIGAESSRRGLQEAVLFGASVKENTSGLQAAASGMLWEALGGSSIQSLIEASALSNEIPVWFFARLIRQESGFNPKAISPVGAMGIAQFMPATAVERGLVNPFDPAQAIPKSAELLKDLKGRFGNLGLAAAAYNAGSQRVRLWLSGQGSLPPETRSYVLAITGRPVQDWAPPGTVLASSDMPLPPKAGTADLGSSLDAIVPSRGKAALAQDRKLELLIQVEAHQRQSGRIRRQERASGEQSLCSLMNSIGSTCIIQKTY